LVEAVVPSGPLIIDPGHPIERKLTARAILSTHDRERLVKLLSAEKALHQRRGLPLMPAPGARSAQGGPIR
jgi:hypothetical protein